MSYPKVESDKEYFKTEELKDHNMHPSLFAPIPSILRMDSGSRLEKAVVSALVEHIISEGGIALWSANAKNIDSRRLAHSVAFVEDIRKFGWKFK
jgi:hypothetical protein